MENRINSYFYRYGIVIIIAAFVLLAGTGLFYNFGLATTVGDETPGLAGALKMIALHTLRPNFPTLYYPALFAFSALPFAVVGLVSLFITGAVSSFVALQVFVIVDFAQLLPWVRLGSVFYAALTLYLLYRTALLVFSEKRPALFATFFLASSLMFFQLAHFGRVWSAELCTIMFTLWAIVRFYQDETPRLSRYCTIALGMALSFGLDIIGAVTYISFVFAYYLKHRDRSWGKIFFGHREFILAHVFLALLFVGVYYLNPYGFVNAAGFVRHAFSSLVNWSGNAVTVVAQGNVRFCGGGWESAGYYLRILIEYEPLLLALSLLGAVALYRARRTYALLVASFALGYWAIITFLSMVGVTTCEPRYASPIILPMALFAGWGVARRLEMFSDKLRYVLTLILVILTIAPVLLFDSKLALPSTRLVAREWIFHHIPAGARIIMLDDTLNIPEDTQTLRDIASYAPEFFTKKRDFLLNERSSIRQGLSYYVLTPQYFRGGLPEALSLRYDYLVVSWWDPGEREKQLADIRSLLFAGKAERVRRFPSDATDDTKSLDLPNNMREPLLKLPTLTQNGPTIDVYQLR